MLNFSFCSSSPLCGNYFAIETTIKVYISPVVLIPSAVGESNQHKKIKELIVKLLKERFDVSIPEYDSSAHEYDAFSTSIEGINLMVEIIWTASTLNFYKDIMILLTSDSQIKLPIVNTEIITNSTLLREFDKVRATEIEKGFIVSSMIDGQKFIDSNSYRSEVKDMISEYLEKARKKRPATNKQRPYCLPTISFSTHNGQTYYVSLRIINVGIESAIGMQVKYDIREVDDGKRTLNIPFLQPQKDVIRSITIRTKSPNGAIRTVQLQYDEKNDRTINVRLAYKDTQDISYETTHELNVRDFY